jgi:hypothetical protein
LGRQVDLADDLLGLGNPVFIKRLRHKKYFLFIKDKKKIASLSHEHFASLPTGRIWPPDASLHS